MLRRRCARWCPRCAASKKDITTSFDVKGVFARQARARQGVNAYITWALGALPQRHIS